MAKITRHRDQTLSITLDQYEEAELWRLVREGRPELLKMYPDYNGKLAIELLTKLTRDGKHVALRKQVIAAAPEMLAALKDVRHAAAVSGILQGWVGTVQTAIKKAERSDT